MYQPRELHPPLLFFYCLPHPPLWDNTLVHINNTRGSAEVLLDANAVRIFEQEIVDVEHTIYQRKKSLSELIMAKKQLSREIDSIENLIKKREQQARTLMVTDDESELVEEVAAEIAEYELSLEAMREQQLSQEKRIQSGEKCLRLALKEVRNYRRDLRMAKAQQIGASGLAKANNLPEQLSELNTTCQHVIALQTEGRDQEDAWIEMEGLMNGCQIEERIKALKKDPHNVRKNQVLERLRQGHS